MKIRTKIILVVLPLIVISLILAGGAAYLSALKGVNRVARQFLNFKAGELEKYAENQWALLEENGYASRPDMVEAAKSALGIYAESVILSESEIIFALNENGEVAMSTSPLEINEDERRALLSLLMEENEGLRSALAGGKTRVFRAFYFTPFQWYVVLTEESSSYYRDADSIAFTTTVVLASVLVLASALLILFSRLLTNPLGFVVKAMRGIIRDGDLSARVKAEYSDETGTLAATFNQMLSELEKANRQIKRHAFNAVLAGKKEQRIRNIFQRYVPKDVIDKFFVSPSSMLEGEDRSVAILFSDIRGFTTISEGFRDRPEELVESLNRYFSGQVDIIYNRKGIVDKYIGDAIMAFWGAPVKHEDDALQSVLAGLDMIDAAAAFNQGQKAAGKPEFHIGIGINYGLVTVGNIGSERKMDYTVIGDMVNLASRMEGLTKTYHAELLISETVYTELKSAGAPVPPCRLLDTVAVKGKNRGVKIYAVKRNLGPREKQAWTLHNQGMEYYYRRDFAAAAKRFQEVLAVIPSDLSAGNLLRRCKAYTLTPPPAQWDGVEVMKTK